MSNRLPKKQKGQRFETNRAFFVRYYHTAEDGKRKQKAVLLAYKSDLYRSWADVEPLIQAELKRVNAEQENTIPTGRVALSEFVEKNYLPWCEANKSAPTANGYKRVWEGAAGPSSCRFPGASPVRWSGRRSPTRPAFR